MFRRYLALFAAAALCAGCVPVTEPVGDIDKAEPDKNLLGHWQADFGDVCIVDRPDVKGNPKGLMRATFVDKGKKQEDADDVNIFWFFTTTVGKQDYANVLLVQGETPYNFAQFRTEGAYAKWSKNDKRGYGIAPYKFDGKKVTVSYGKGTETGNLMKQNQFTQSGGIYQTSPGWLAKQLEKDGLRGVFEEFGTYTRAKK